MLPTRLPSASDLAELTEHRHDASVSIYLASSPKPTDNQAMRLTLKNAAREAAGELESAGHDNRTVNSVIAPISDLDGDLEFWQAQRHGLGVLAAPGVLLTFALSIAPAALVAVGNRFDVGPLLRAITFENGGYVLAVTEGDIRLYELTDGNRPIEVPLPDLPDDLHTVLEHAVNFGQADQQRAAGALGQKVEQQRYCRLVQDAVLKAIGESTRPLVLAASMELEPAYRAINTYRGLLGRGIRAHPDSFEADELDAKARRILDEHYVSELKNWRENFGTQRSKGLATSKLADVARAATSAAVAELYFDMDAVIEGTIDEGGEVSRADAPGPETYGLVDEIAARVLRSGGTVRALRNEDLIDGSPVAAMLRFPI